MIYEICAHEIFEKFVYKNSETIEYVKNLPTFFLDIYKLHGQITPEFLRLIMRNFQGLVFVWTQTNREIFKSVVYISGGPAQNDKTKNSKLYHFRIIGY